MEQPILSFEDFLKISAAAAPMFFYTDEQETKDGLPEKRYLVPEDLTLHELLAKRLALLKLSRS